MRILVLDTIYDNFLRDLYASRPGLEGTPYDDQIAAIAESFFPCGLTWRRPFQGRNHEVLYVAANNAPSQIRWCQERDRLDLVGQSVEYYGFGFYQLRIAHPRMWYLKIAEEQVKAFQPDVILCPYLYTFDSEFLRGVAGSYGRAVGQHAAAIPRADLSRYDLIVSSLPNQVAYFQRLGIRSALLPLAFDPLVAERLGKQPLDHDVVFLGQISTDHRNRAEHFRELSRSIEIDFWGDADWEGRPPDPRHWHAHPAVWGFEMYRGLARSRIVLNHHLDAAGPYANNLRLYEATGVGSLLLTDFKENLASLFVIGEEVITYTDTADCATQVRALLADEDRRAGVARAGQQRVLRDHTYDHRAAALLDMIGALA
jgi:spore maturation protein CgeB